MILASEKGFILQTCDTTYIFRTTPYGHLEHIYYGQCLKSPDIEALSHKRTAQAGSTVAYTQDDLNYSLDRIPMEWSGIGKGDYRHSPAEIKMPDGSFVSDFIYQSHEINENTLTIHLNDNNVQLILTYTVYETANVITRRAQLTNNDSRPITIRRLASLMLDMAAKEIYILTTFDGDWTKEAHRHDRPLQYGMFINESRTGASSNKHNPGFLLAEPDAAACRGSVYGFNLIYSGNHMSYIERNSHELVRIGIGISPHCFEWELKQGETFQTPEAVMTYSNQGYNGMSRNFHNFINNHIIPEAWRMKPRPIKYNSWEPCFFKFTESKLVRLARQAKKLGMELFVLDDGWFKGRDNDSAGLGDYEVNKKKFPRGLARFANKIRKIGLDFGIWFEPEMVNPDSDLYRAHPEYAVQGATMGRNQLVLDLTNPDVRDYIVDSVSRIIDETDAAYVKWDMNRHISEFPNGRFFHEYILGLYDVLERIFTPRPHVLLESCSSGGNRFDLGMLRYSPQIWTSDNTDPVCRLEIQGGLSYLYPPSTMGAHVSDAPHQQTLRETPLSTRFNVACYGVLGYEMDLRHLSPVERKEIKSQIEFYKQHRMTFQYGNFKRQDTPKDNKTLWVSQDKNTTIAGLFQGTAKVSEGADTLRIPNLDHTKRYKVKTRPQRLYIKRFGGLVKHIMPIALNPSGLILLLANRYHALIDCVEEYECGGDTLEAGVLLNNQFNGTHYNNKTRLLGDYGSNLYVVTPS
ncbi:MAG: alpha-galactosidase [Defluviitaleaceae bacterium]|nr:alpha-galactosidase [Defluviitaleaceae bacterium]